MDQAILDILLGAGTVGGAVMLLLGPRRFVALLIGGAVMVFLWLVSSYGRWRCVKVAVVLVLLALAACATRPDVQWPSGPWSSVDENTWRPSPDELKELQQVP